MKDGASHLRAVRVRHVRRPHEPGPRPGHLRHRGTSTELGRPPDGARDLHRHVHRRIRPHLGQDHRPREVRVCSVNMKISGSVNRSGVNHREFSR